MKKNLFKWAIRHTYTIRAFMLIYPQQLLHYAINHLRDINKLKIVLNLALDINGIHNGHTALSAAVLANNVTAIELLLERADIEPNKFSSWGPPLHCAVKLACDTGIVDPLKCFLDSNNLKICYSVYYKGTILEIPISQNLADILKLIIDKKKFLLNEIIVRPHDFPDHNLPPLLSQCWMQPLHYAVQLKRLKIVEILLDYKELNPNAVMTLRTNNVFEYQTALHLAILNNTLEMVQVLLNKGVDSSIALTSSAALSEKFLPVRLAHKNLEILKTLLNYGAAITLFTEPPHASYFTNVNDPNRMDESYIKAPEACKAYLTYAAYNQSITDYMVKKLDASDPDARPSPTIVLGQSLVNNMQLIFSDKKSLLSKLPADTILNISSFMYGDPNKSHPFYKAITSSIANELKPYNKKANPRADKSQSPKARLL